MNFGAFVLGLTLAVFDSGQLGISVSDTANGVRVDTVHASSPAEKAGIREGDLVVEFDGERVRSAMQLTRLVRETPEGRQVAVAVMRDGKRQTLQATPEEAPFPGDPMGRWREYRVVPPIYRYDNPRQYRLPDMFEFRDRVPMSRGRLGITVQSLTPDLEEYFGVKNGGALVSSVTRNSVGSRAGIKPGDVITSINGRSVSDSSDLMRELRDLDGEVTIVVMRDKKEVTLKGTLGRD